MADVHSSEGLGEIKSGVSAMTIPEVRSLVYGAFDGGEVDVSKYQREFAKLDSSQQDDVFKALLSMEDQTGRDLSYFHVQQGAHLGPDYIEAIRKCVVVLKLLQAICVFKLPQRVRYYAENIQTYESMFDNYKQILAVQDNTVANTDAVVKQ